MVKISWRDWGIALLHSQPGLNKAASPNKAVISIALTHHGLTGGAVTFSGRLYVETLGGVFVKRGRVIRGGSTPSLRKRVPVTTTTTETTLGMLFDVLLWVHYENFPRKAARCTVGLMQRLSGFGGWEEMMGWLG